MTLPGEYAPGGWRRQAEVLHATQHRVTNWNHSHEDVPSGDVGERASEWTDEQLRDHLLLTHVLGVDGEGEPGWRRRAEHRHATAHSRAVGGTAHTHEDVPNG